MGVARKLEDVCRDLALLAEQGKVMGFLTNTENAQRISGLVEDIRDAMIAYQVCASNHLILPCLTIVVDFITTRYLRQRSSTHRESHLLAFCPHGLTDR